MNLRKYLVAVLRGPRIMMDMLVLLVTPRCQRIVREALEASADRPHSAWQRFYIGIHRRCCRFCDQYLKNQALIGAAARRLDGSSVSAESSDSTGQTDPNARLSRAAQDRILSRLRADQDHC